MGSQSPRLERVADQLQRELAVLIQQELKDPRLGMISVTGVTVSRDLGYADVYITALDNAITGRDHRPAADTEEASGPPVPPVDGSIEAEGAEQHRQALEILTGAAGFLRSQLGKRLTLRTTPRLRFHYDESIARGRHLSSLIDSAVAADRNRTQE
ncbi:MAG: 30S ribosome-binding factor RbfA [Pseudomonadota bacterium]